MYLATISTIPANTLALGSPLNAAARPPHEASLSLVHFPSPLTRVVAVNYQGGSRVSRPSPCLHIARLVSNSTGKTWEERKRKRGNRNRNIEPRCFVLSRLTQPWPGGSSRRSDWMFYINSLSILPFPIQQLAFAFSLFKLFSFLLIYS